VDGGGEMSKVVDQGKVHVILRGDLMEKNQSHKRTGKEGSIRALTGRGVVEFPKGFG